MKINAVVSEQYNIILNINVVNNKCWNKLNSRQAKCHVRYKFNLFGFLF